MEPVRALTFEIKVERLYQWPNSILRCQLSSSTTENRFQKNRTNLPKIDQCLPNLPTHLNLPKIYQSTLKPFKSNLNRSKSTPNLPNSTKSAKNLTKLSKIDQIQPYLLKSSKSTQNLP